MLTEDYLSLDALLDKLSPDLDKKYKIRSVLVPRWKNFLAICDRFDRYPEMITHGSTHVCNILALAADLIIPALNSHSQKKTSPVTDEELFLLIAGIFLHDIGMADVQESTADPNKVRTKHSVLTGEILKTRFANRPSAPDENLLPGMDLHEVDAIAQICIHHQSRAPILEKHKTLTSTASSLEYLLKYDNHLQLFNNKPIDICLVTALLRLLDACDVQYSRAGSVFFTKNKIINNARLIQDCQSRKQLIQHINNSLDLFYDEYEKYLNSINNTRSIQVYQSRKQLIQDINNSSYVFYDEYEKYLNDQAVDHFPKHSFIQKVWIINGEVVYKPVDLYERRLLNQIMSQQFQQMDHYLKMFEEEVKQECSLCNPFLEKRGLAITCIRSFNDKEDPWLTKKLPSCNKKWFQSYSLARLFQRDGLLRSITASSDRLSVFAHPQGSGKTYLAKNLASQFSTQKKKLCFISFGDAQTTDKTQLLDFCFKQLVCFLAGYGNYLFYNKIRTEWEIEEEQWDVLLQELDQEDHVFILDDLHLLPLAQQSGSPFKFMDLFFNQNKARIIIFTQKVPYPLTLMKAPQYSLRKITPFTDQEIERIASRDIYVGFKDWPSASNIIARYNTLPVVLDILRNEADSLPQTMHNAADGLEDKIHFLMERHIVKNIRGKLSREATELLDFFIHYPSHVIQNMDKLAAYTGLEPDNIKAAWDDLQYRGLVFMIEPARDTWKINSWWRSINSNPWNNMLQSLDIGNPVSDPLFDSIPELNALKGLVQNAYHHLDAWEHTFEVFKLIRVILNKPEEWIAPLPFPENPELLLLAALLHDIGKPSCRQETEKGAQFIGHEKQGAAMANAICSRFSLDKQQIEYVATIVENHSRPRQNLPLSPHAVNRFIKELKPYLSELFVLVLADIQSTRGVNSQVGEDLKNVKELLQTVAETLQSHTSIR